MLRLNLVSFITRALILTIVLITSNSATYAAGCPEALGALKSNEATSQRIVVLDTNALYTDPEIISRLSDQTVIIPRAVIEEMDRHKMEKGERSQTARYVSSTIRKLIIGLSPGSTAAPLEGGGTLHIYEGPKDHLIRLGLDPEKADDRIIATAQWIKENNPSREVVVISGDNNLTIMAHSLGLSFEDPKAEKGSSLVRELLSGPQVIQISSEAAKRLSDLEGALSLELAVELGLPENFVPANNEFIVFEVEGEDTFDKDRAMDLIWRTRISKDGRVAFHPVNEAQISQLVIQPRNAGQIMALDLLFDQRVKLVTLAGTAGTGKTLLTLAAGLAQSTLFGQGKSAFEKIILTRPNQVTGQEMGFLPGSLKEKMEPYMGPFKDNLQVIIEALRERRNGETPHKLENGVSKARDRENRKITSIADLLDDRYTVKEAVEQLVNSDFFSIETITYSRGRSWNKTLLIIDEAQNLTEHELKTILTRAGQGTKVVLLGDVEQIDNKLLNFTNNGLVITADRFFGKHLAAHITLTQGERSELATMAAELLR